MGSYLILDILDLYGQSAMSSASRKENQSYIVMSCNAFIETRFAIILVLNLSTSSFIRKAHRSFSALTLTFTLTPDTLLQTKF